MFSASLAIWGCCDDAPESLTLAVSGTTPRWGETFEYPAHELRASFEQGNVLGGEVFEVYEGDLRTMPSAPMPAPLELPSTETVDEYRCGTVIDVTYDLTALEPGAYTVVHRRASGTGDRLNCTGPCPWTTFDGEEALVMTLVITTGDP